MQILAVWLAGAWACGVVGCGDGGSGSAGNKDQFIAQLCAEYSGCCKAAGRPSDGAQCRALYGALTPASGYDAQAAQACLDEVRARGDSCDTSSAGTPSCRKVFSADGGTKQPGEACEDNTDCAAPASGEVECVSEFANGATVQQCQVQLQGTEGSTPCIGTVDGPLTIYSGTDGIPPTGYLCHVADGLSCDSQTYACTRLADVGEACSTGSYRCVPAAYCDSVESVCRERLALGAACTDDDECATTAYCEPSSTTCVARRGVNEACTTDAECQSDDCTNQKCVAEDDLALAFLCGTN
ncbi:hypothetical protein [Sorangium sp. So ce1000]|uniref:hypothetical protein n=1 Tax=Sorangium sp. So ce1000 TaxID=3133325 RepID=UPI003F5DE3E6